MTTEAAPVMRVQASRHSHPDGSDNALAKSRAQSTSTIGAPHHLGRALRPIFNLLRHIQRNRSGVPATLVHMSVGMSRVEEDREMDRPPHLTLVEDEPRAATCCSCAGPAVVRFA